MKFTTFITAATLALSSTAQCSKYSQLLANSVIARNTPLGKTSTGAVLTSYEHGIMERALQMVYNATGNDAYYTYHKTGVDNIISSAGTLLDYNLTYYTLDDIRLGPEFLYLHLRTGQVKYKTAAETLRLQIQSQPRNAEGGMWHRSTYQNQMWLDGQFMALPFYAQWTKFFDARNESAWADIVLQFSLLEAHVRNCTTGLLKHGYDGGKSAVWADLDTGSAPLVWDRALGWYLMALVDVLDYFPRQDASSAVLIGYFVRAAAAVKIAADPNTGAWWLVMSQEYAGAPGNYIESSGSAMFVYAFLKGVRLGYLPRAEYFPVAKRAYEYLVGNCVVDRGNGVYDWEGTVQVGSLGSKGDYAYYVSVPKRTNDLKGIGPFIYASVEFEMLD
ncbi:cell wall glycosyl hydrolase YteR [Tuber brumale]|nr:cell wall glycosyl hydrolase YteR [Tuber brumale]